MRTRMFRGFSTRIGLSGVAPVLALALVLAGCGSGGDEDRAEVEAPVSAVATAPDEPVESPTLIAVKRRGYLNCGVHEGLVGFA